MRPMHVQRCEFKTKLLDDVTGVDSLFRYAYMGSAEYEFGSLPGSLRRIVADRSTFGFFDTKLRARNGSSLMAYCANKKRDETIDTISGIADGKIRTKDGSHLPEVIVGKDPQYYRAEAWWDVDNDWIAFLGQKRQPLIEKAIECIASKWANRPAA